MRTHPEIDSGGVHGESSVCRQRTAVIANVDRSQHRATGAGGPTAEYDEQSVLSNEDDRPLSHLCQRAEAKATAQRQSGSRRAKIKRSTKGRKRPSAEDGTGLFITQNTFRPPQHLKRSVLRRKSSAEKWSARVSPGKCGTGNNRNPMVVTHQGCDWDVALTEHRNVGSERGACSKDVHTPDLNKSVPANIIGTLLGIPVAECCGEGGGKG